MQRAFLGTGPARNTLFASDLTVPWHTLCPGDPQVTAAGVSGAVGWLWATLLYLSTFFPV